MKHEFTCEDDLINKRRFAPTLVPTCVEDFILILKVLKTSVYC